MKNINLIAVLSLMIICLSCNKESVNTSSSDLKLELVVNNTTEQSSEPNADNIIAVLDIKSYNAKTGEVIFNNTPPDNIDKWQHNEYKVNVYTNNDSRLFTLTFANSLFSNLYNEPVLYYSLVDNSEIEGTSTEKDKWYILSGYPYGKLLTPKTITDAEQLENFKKIESDWNLFIDELKKSKKYID